MPKEGDLVVWWIPQVPMKAFEVPVKNIDEAKLLMDVLAAYDFFQYKMNVKPDYSNAGGLKVFENGEWLEWENEDCEDIKEICRKEEPPKWLKEIFSQPSKRVA